MGPSFNGFRIASMGLAAGGDKVMGAEFDFATQSVVPESASLAIWRVVLMGMTLSNLALSR